MRLTVFFDGQFWMGIFEWEAHGLTRAHRHVFGAEPGDGEILDLVKDWAPSDIPETEDAAAPSPPPHASNPKRRAREAARLLARRGGSTKAREALQRELEERKGESRRETRARREAAKEKRRETAGQKAKEKHRGH
jgi:hypothetical protein